MNKINLLVVEDQEEQRIVIFDSIDEFNDESENLKIEASHCKNYEEAIELLDKRCFDALFLDLKLENDAATEDRTSGNFVLDYLIDNGIGPRLIIFIISGTLGSLSDKYENFFSSPLLQKHGREEKTLDILGSLVEIWNTGVTKLLGPSGKLHSLVNKIYYEHLAPGFSYWKKQGSFTEIEMLRYTVSHIMEYLDEAEAKSQEGSASFLPPEFYISPPIKKSPSPGEITVVNGNYYITLSPACDLVKHSDGGNPYFNVERVVLAELIPLKREIFNEKSVKFHKTATSNTKWKTFEQDARKNNKQRFHYLPKYNSIPESLVDFKSIKNVKIDEFLDEYKSIATINQMFLKDIQARFSSYYARQGQPDGVWLR